MIYNDLALKIAYFLSEYPPEFLLALLIIITLSLSFLWVAIGYIVYYLSSIGGEKEC